MAAAVLLFGGGCRPAGSSDHPPGYLVVGIESNPLDLDPRYATDANSVRIDALIYNALLRADDKLRLRPELASEWKMTDPRTYVFELRKNIKFHNGKAMTARDVKYTYESMLDPRNQSPKRPLLKALEVVDELDPYRVRFRLSVPYAPFPEQFTIGIVPAQSKGFDTRRKEIPPGSGPFMLDSIDRGERITLKANPAYWEKKPQLAGIIFKVVPDAMVRALEFKKGTIDFLQNDLEPDMLPWLKDNAHAVVDAHVGTTFQYIGVNLTHPILKHREVRQAIALAIDRDSIIRHLLKGYATPASGLLSPIHWAYNGSVQKWSFNPERAKRLLDHAGYPDPDGPGPRPRFRISFKTTNLDLRKRIAEALKEQLARVGIELEIRTYEWGTFYSDIIKGNFHLYSLAWVGVMDPDIYYQLFHSAAIPPNGDNRGHYSNPDLDRLLEQGRSTTDASARKAVYFQVQRILADELPYIPLWWVKNVIVQHAGIRGFVPYPDGDLISLKKVSLQKQLP
jgi:peptide/nickel transport system substrate-binding protein